MFYFFMFLIWKMGFKKKKCSSCFCSKKKKCSSCEKCGLRERRKATQKCDKVSFHFKKNSLLKTTRSKRNHIVILFLFCLSRINRNGAEADQSYVLYLNNDYGFGLSSSIRSYAIYWSTEMHCITKERWGLYGGHRESYKGRQSWFG